MSQAGASSRSELRGGRRRNAFIAPRQKWKLAWVSRLWLFSRRLVFVSTLHQDERIMVGQYHSRVLCRCGCRGSHTAQAILDKIAYDFRVAAGGAWPDADSTGVPWPEGSWRSRMSGRPLFPSQFGFGHCR
eukprot:9491513-Pyramimonas_sp.AAC.1